WIYLVLALVAYLGAMWFYGLLFRESVHRSGGEVKAWSAFKAALVGAGVARLIPAAGAITPGARAGAVRGETERAAGPPRRVVLLNDAGLLIMAGAGLLVARPREGAQVASVSLVIVAPIVLIVGLVRMFGSGKLVSLSKGLP